MRTNNVDSKISLKEKAAYGFGDFASSMFWKLFSMFLLFFYTDVFGLAAAAVGTMFLLVRIFDAVADLFIGAMCDRTTTKWGKFRPYLLFGALPFAVIGIITFITPNLSTTGKLVYAYVTYASMMIVYSLVNVPYSSLLGVMTNNPDDRTSLASFRFIGAFSGGLFVTVTANYLVEFFGKGGSEATGYQWTVGVYAVLAALFFVLTFAGTKERLKPAVAPKSSLKEDFRDLAKNGPWFIMLGAGISVLIFNSLRDGSILYYFKYFIKDQTVNIFGTEYSFSHSALASAYMSIWLATNIIGVVIAKPLAGKIGKRNAFLLSVIASAGLSFMIFFLQPHQISLIFIFNILIGISAGIVLPLIWSMYADVADYSEWKTGRRATGLIFSSSTMSQKFGWTLGGALNGWLLSAFGFQANVEQTDTSLLGIRLMLTIFAGIGALLAIVFMYIYPLTEKYMGKVNNELEAARASVN
ncbi:MAG: MFS transporter [Bacteroidota bacterium]